MNEKAKATERENVTGGAKATGETTVTGGAKATGKMTVTGGTKMTGRATVTGGAKETGKMTVRGEAKAIGGAKATGWAGTVWMAPLRGVTLAPFRRLVSERFGGVDLALAPFVALGSSERMPVRLFADVAPDACGPLPTVPQVIGRDPVALRAAGRILRDLGHTRMNLNCGCPWKFVAKKGRGSGLPEDPDAFARMLEAGCEAMPGGFSVKIRLGYRTPDTLAARAELLNEFPLECIVVHPRTGVQMYDGNVDLDAFAAVLPLLRAPVVYNGDIATPADAARILSRFPTLSGLMLGRGLCANPALAAELRGAPTPPRKELAAFAGALASEYAATLCGPAPLMGRLKELWGYLHRSFENGDDGLRRIQRATSLPALESAITALAGPGAVAAHDR